MSGGEPPPRGFWERACVLLFRLYPLSYRSRHGLPRQALMREMLASETDPIRRRSLSRRFTADALRTLPRAWGEALLGTTVSPSGGARVGSFWSSSWQDLRHSVRSFLRQPILPLVAVLSIALGIGFNAALFSAFNALLLRPAPGIPDPDRVVEIGRTDEGRGFDSFSFPDLVSLREGASPLEHVSAWRMIPLSYGGEGAGERVVGMAVSAGYFEALGAALALGRSFRPEDDAREAPAVAVVSDGFWRTRLDADPNVVGRTILVNRVPVTVIGVAAREFAGHFRLVQTEVWLPFLRSDIAEPDRNPRSYEDRRTISHQVVARLADGATLEQAQAAVSAVMANLAEVYAETNEGRGASVVRLSPIPGGGATIVRGFLGLLMGLVFLILGVAVANVAGMLLARAAAREKEVAIRLAIGSGRARLVRQLLVETLVLALAGAAGGMLLASWATSLVTTVEGPGLSITLDLSPDARVFAFALVLAVFTAGLAGGVPALQASRPELLSALKQEGRGGTRGTRARRAFVALQVGVSVVLLAAGGLLVRSLAEATRMGGGFVPEGVHLTSLDLSLDGYASDRLPDFQEELRASLSREPRVEAAALALDLPLDMSENAAPIWPDGWTGEERGMGADFNTVSPGYFETLRIPLVRGRDFTPADREIAAPVVIVSETLARRAWGEEDPVGRTLRWGGAGDTPRTVIGVVGEVKNQSLGESDDGMVYLPLAQRRTPAVHVLVRGSAVDGALLRRTLLSADPRLTLSLPQTLDAVTAVSLLPSRVAAAVTGLLGALGLFLSSLGVYGVVAHTVAQRRREIGVRIALGAGRRRVLWITIAGGLRLALPGLLLGGAAAFGVAQLLRSLLLGISPADPLTFGAVVAVLLAAIALASWIPARSAAAVDPMEALRAE